MPKLLRITTVPISLQNLLRGQFKYMQQNGFEVFLASSKGKEINFIEQDTGIKVNVLPLERHISIFKDLKALLSTYRLIRQIKPDIVHTHTPKAGLIGMLAAWLAQVPIRLHTVAGLPVMEAQGIKKKILFLTERITSWSATGIYPNSFALQSYMIDNKLVAVAKTKVIAYGSSNGIDMEFYSNKHFPDHKNQLLRQELSISENDFVFCFIGRLVGDKGINELIDAFANLTRNTHAFSTNVELSTNSTPVTIENDVSVKLLLVGSEEIELDPLLPTTKKIIEQHPDIIGVGWQNDVRPYLAISDCFVFPSYREGFPNAVLQAGAMELPQIVTNINGCNEIIINHLNGLIIPKKDAMALHEAMTKILLDIELRNKLILNSRSTISHKFEQNIIWKGWLNEYNSLINKQINRCTEK